MSELIEYDAVKLAALREISEVFYNQTSAVAKLIGYTTNLADAQQQRIEALESLLSDAHGVVRSYAIQNPKFEYGGYEQDPMGSHDLLERLEDAALAKGAGQQ